MYNLCCPGTYNLINFNFFCPRALVLKITNSGMLISLCFFPRTYVTRRYYYFFVFLSMNVCKKYVKKTNSGMLNFFVSKNLLNIDNFLYISGRTNSGILCFACKLHVFQLASHVSVLAFTPFQLERTMLPCNTCLLSYTAFIYAYNI
jgi:hypothetical protein